MNSGQLDAGFIDVLLDETPFAIVSLIEGLFALIKLPHIASRVNIHGFKASVE